ncbi:MAG: M13 family metallopeptidase [Alphaproteobacteria bacterium]|nr:M13 family metallopeptidase [Alphaproteobacteria bacterium]
MRLVRPSLILLAACATSRPAPSPAPLRGVLAEVEASVESALDRSADACTDFYRFACGGWLDAYELPPDRSVFGRGFSAIAEGNQQILKGLLEAGGGDPRLGAYYEACMDTAAVEAAGADPLAADLARIDAAPDATALLLLSTELAVEDVFLGAGVFPDFTRPDTNAFHIAQGGLGLPERGYYFPEDDEGRALLADYEAHVGAMLGLAGRDPAAAAAVLAIETALATASRAPADMRDPRTLHHPTAVADLPSVDARVPWTALLAALDLDDVEQLNVMTPEFFPALGEVLAERPLDDLRAYVAWHLVHAAAPYLSSSFDEAHFAFYGTRLTGQQQQRDRWKRCVDRVDDAMGELLGAAYVAEAFAGDSKATALAMVGDVEGAFAAGLADLAWMDEPTRERAHAKLDAITNKIGYPDAPETYEGLALADGSWANQAAVAAWSRADQLAKVGEPVDRAEWGMSAPTVNAYYNPLMNEIVFPAGILQPPFFSADFPTAMNYGAIGMVIGHEITHGFDDSGRHFGPDGTMAPWWDDEVGSRFDTQAACVAGAYDGLEVAAGATVNGQLTLGENIADLGGIKLASAAYAHWLQEGGRDARVAGFTPEQLLFVGYAQSWCTEMRPEAEALRARTDSHSPPRYRVNVPLQHTPAFRQAFSCEVGSPMAPAETCAVW